MAKEIEQQPITIGAFVKWTGVGVTILVAIVSGIWKLSQVEAATHAEIEPIKTQVVVNSNEITTLKAKSDRQDNSINAMEKKLDTAVAILQRIDAKVGRP